jgi:hypothetical protein
MGLLADAVFALHPADERHQWKNPGHAGDGVKEHLQPFRRFADAACRQRHDQQGIKDHIGNQSERSDEFALALCHHILLHSLP